MKLSIVIFFISLLNFQQKEMPEFFSIGSDNVVNVKKFGAKGDGITNDYLALLSAAKYIVSKGTGTLYFPKGTYFIKNYKTKENNYSNIEFINCVGLNIIGENAIISVNGKFNRGADYQTGTRNKWYSKTNAITPFSFINCKNVLVKNLEINGNVNLMTRTAGVVESAAHLISINECENVTLTNLNLHHAQTDGIYITGAKRPSRNLKLNKVTSSNNGRQGMSITSLIGAQFLDCNFVKTGMTEGDYGFHAPGAGVDVEPNVNLVKDLIFENCDFSNNLGGQFICTSPARTSDVTLLNCSITSSIKSSKRTVVLSAKRIKLLGCTIDCKNGNVYTSVLGGSVIEISRNVIKSNLSGIRAESKNDDDTVTISNNILINSSSKKMTTYFPYLISKGLSFTNNKIHIPSRIIDEKKTTSVIENAIISAENTFESDFNRVLPKISYKGTKSIRDHK